MTLHRAVLVRVAQRALTCVRGDVSRVRDKVRIDALDDAVELPNLPIEGLCPVVELDVKEQAHSRRRRCNRVIEGTLPRLPPLHHPLDHLGMRVTRLVIRACRTRD